MTLPEIRTIPQSTHSTIAPLRWAQHWLNVDPVQSQAGMLAHEALEGKYVGKKGKFKEPPVSRWTLEEPGSVS